MELKQYIGREALLAAYDREHEGEPGRARKLIVNAPAEDVLPVRHGRWVKTIGENGVTSACRCNLCGFEDNRYSPFNYCPNCGAKMDEEEE